MLIEPGGVKTPIWQKGRELADKTTASMPPEADRLYGPLVEALRTQTARIERETGIPPRARCRGDRRGDDRAQASHALSGGSRRKASLGDGEAAAGSRDGRADCPRDARLEAEAEANIIRCAAGRLRAGRDGDQPGDERGVWCRRFEPRRRRRRTAVTSIASDTRPAPASSAAGAPSSAGWEAPAPAGRRTFGPEASAGRAVLGLDTPSSTRSGSGSDSPPARPRPPAGPPAPLAPEPAGARSAAPAGDRPPPAARRRRAEPPPARSRETAAAAARACAARPRSVAAPFAGRPEPERSPRPASGDSCASTRRPPAGALEPYEVANRTPNRAARRPDGVQALDGVGGRLGVGRAAPRADRSRHRGSGRRAGRRPPVSPGRRHRGRRPPAPGYGTGHVGIAGRRAGDAEAAVLRLRALEPGE